MQAQKQGSVPQPPLVAHTTDMLGAVPTHVTLRAPACGSWITPSANLKDIIFPASAWLSGEGGWTYKPSKVQSCED